MTYIGSVFTACARVCGPVRTRPVRDVRRTGSELGTRSPPVKVEVVGLKPQALKAKRAPKPRHAFKANPSILNHRNSTDR